MLLLVGFIALATLSAAYIYKHYSRTFHLSKNFPGPPALPIIGHCYLLFGKRPDEYFETIRELLMRYGKTLKFWIGPEFNLILADLKDVEVVLGTHRFNDKAEEYSVLEPWLKEGLLVSKGRKWFQRRKIITPAFHFQVLKQFVEIFERQAEFLIQSMKQCCDEGKELDLYALVSLYTLDTICESAMGVNLNAQTNSESSYVKAVKTISTVLHKRMFDIIYRLNFTYQFTSLAREEQKALSILHSFSENIIVSRREDILRNREVDKLITKKAFLDILLQSEIDGKPLSDLDIREEVDTFMFEGHDTTSSAILFFFYNIANYPDCQKKCYEEIQEVFGSDKQAAITYDALSRLSYVELCVKETLRMFPSVPLMGRKVHEECEINGKIIPRGTNIGISPLYLGRLEELYPNPDEFQPERFQVTDSKSNGDATNPSTGRAANPFAYIPFSAGPRNCIGQKFAMLEIKSVAVNVLRHFEVEYCGDAEEGLVLVGELILRTRDPLMFRLKKRDQ